MTKADAERYRQEWGDHLVQLIEDGQRKQAATHRRRLVFTAVAMAIILRSRHFLNSAVQAISRNAD